MRRILTCRTRTAIIGPLLSTIALSILPILNASQMTLVSSAVVLTALNALAPKQNLKAAILRTGEFEGLQGKLMFDAYGDVEKFAVMRIIRNRKFAGLE